MHYWKSVNISGIPKTTITIEFPQHPHLILDIYKRLPESLELMLSFVISESFGVILFFILINVRMVYSILAVVSKTSASIKYFLPKLI